ncbi:MAG: acetylglutamate kinase [Clostridia bacterium]|nr:acetylglutamate kinase [Clostridia bacterium]
MNLTNQEKADILVQALPYIQRYNDKILVVKFGGNAMTSEAQKLSTMRDLVLLAQVGIKVVLVHGGGPEIDAVLDRMNIETKRLNGLRVTDDEQMSVVQMVLAGKVNKDLVASVEAVGGTALGLCGVDGGMIKAKVKDPELGYVGDIVSINPKPILDALNAGYIPVISTIGYDQTGKVYNINADTAASRIAGALGAHSLINMTATKGVLKDPKDENTLIPEIKISEVEGLKAEGIISGGMIPKVECCVEAVELGVKNVFIIDGRVPHAILIEVLSDKGIGTLFCKED